MPKRFHSGWYHVPWREKNLVEQVHYPLLLLEFADRALEYPALVGFHLSGLESVLSEVSMIDYHLQEKPGDSLQVVCLRCLPFLSGQYPRS